MAKEMTEFNNRLDKLAEYCMNSGRFDQDLYIEYDVKRGLRDSNGKGILTGLTEISSLSNPYMAARFRLMASSIIRAIMS